MQNKDFLKTAFSKNAKRIITKEQNGAFVITGYCHSGKTTFLKELILLFEDVYSKSVDNLEMFLFDGKGEAFRIFDKSCYTVNRSVTSQDMIENNHLLDPLINELKIPSFPTSRSDAHRRKLIIIDECSAFQKLIPNDVKYLYWLIDHAKEMEMTVIIADQIESLDLFNNPSITQFIRMTDFRTFKIRNSSRLIDVPYLSEEEFLKIQKKYKSNE